MEGLEQADAAECMKISRPTYQRVLYAARKKIAAALLGGKAIRIEGGNFEFTQNDESNNNEKKQQGIKGENMKIAVITSDGKTISKHFGMAPYYVIVTVENGKIVKKEQREKAGHHNMGDHTHPTHTPGEKHGQDTESHSKHMTMAESMSDSKLLIAGGMGWGAYDSLNRMGIKTIITDVDDIEEAVKLYMEGKLTDLAAERLH